MRRKLLHRMIGIGVVVGLALLTLVTIPLRATYAAPVSVTVCRNGYEVLLPAQGFGPPPTYFSATASVTSVTPAGSTPTVFAGPTHGSAGYGIFSTLAAVGTSYTINVHEITFSTTGGVTTQTGTSDLVFTGLVPNCMLKFPPEAGDERINQGHGDLLAAIYALQDDQGNPDLQIWCVDSEGHGQFGIAITQADIAKVPAKPDVNTLVTETSLCRARVAFYVLTTGAYQINIGPDSEGKLYAMAFTGLPPSDIYFANIDPQVPHSQ